MDNKELIILENIKTLILVAWKTLYKAVDIITT